MDKGIYSTIDACLNRAVEGMRVCEDLLRFYYRRDDYSLRLKEMRHRIVSEASVFPAGMLLSGRDVESDAQKFTDLGDEKGKSPHDLLRTNLHRAMEAVRTLEETVKLTDMHGRADNNRFQEIRFSLYQLEKDVMSAVSRGEKTRLLSGSVYAIIDSAFVKGSYETAARKLLAGGARIIQLRMKREPSGAILRAAELIAPICRGHGVLFIVNDHPDIAFLAGADGVHLGQDDIPVRDARRIITDSMIVGVSTHSYDQAIAAAAAGPDYIAVGPVFGTSSKDGTEITAIGIDPVKKIHAATNLPIVGIGGVTPGNASVMRDAGCSAVAVISFLYRDNALEENCREMAEAMEMGAG